MEEYGEEEKEGTARRRWMGGINTDLRETFCRGEETQTGLCGGNLYIDPRWKWENMRRGKRIIFCQEYLMGVTIKR